MKLLMDADCLIKITKAGLKDFVGGRYIISIPGVVQREVVYAGKEKGCSDALIVEKNIEAKVIKIAETSRDHTNGDEALIALFRKEEYNAVATDDVKLTRFLRIKNIPFILPALIIYQLLQDNLIDRKTALWALNQLAEFISEDEYSTVRLLMETTK
jgi:rRNA-processing protein FCF1